MVVLMSTHMSLFMLHTLLYSCLYAGLYMCALMDTLNLHVRVSILARAKQNPGHSEANVEDKSCDASKLP